MKPKPEEFLYLLLWTCDMLWHPTWRNLTDSFEAWAYRNGFLRELQRLEKEQWLERQPACPGERLLRLTEAGRMHALGGCDPEVRWNRRWDGHWRLALFDVPEGRAGLRDKFRRYLQARGFGYLQHSVWITPDPVEDERKLLADAPPDVGTLLFMEARPCAGESDKAIVGSAWDFAGINAHYASYLRVLARYPGGQFNSDAAAEVFRRWVGEERQAWLEALKDDPLLPESLLPAGYLGREAWRRRLSVMRAAGERMRRFEGSW
jgi:phenylacetic acid degradation operon negative regulatory protein